MKNNWSVVFILLIALGLRLAGSNQSFWLDEAAQALESARPISQQLELASDFQPPLYHLLLHLWMLGGASEWYLRLVSIIPGVITVWVTILIARKLKNQHVALMAGLLLATSQFHIFYSQELRPYSLNAMFAVLSVLFLLEVWSGVVSYRIPYVLSLVGGLYSGYLFPFFMIFQLVATVIWHKAQRKQIILSMLVAGVSFLPWVPMFIKQLQTGLGWAEASSVWKAVVSPPLIKMIPLTALKIVVGRLSFASVKLLSLVALSVFGYNAITALVKKNGPFVALWLGLPIVLALLVSIVVPVLDPKRVLFCLPALYILVALNLNKSIKSLLIILVMVNVNLIAVKMYSSNVQEQREPWKKAIQTIELSHEPESAVVFTFNEPFAPWQWYSSGTITAIAVTKDTVNQEQWNNILAINNHPKTLFLFDYLSDIADPDRQIAAWIHDAGYKEVGFYQYPGIGKIRIMKLDPSHTLAITL